MRHKHCFPAYSLPSMPTNLPSRKREPQQLTPLEVSSAEALAAFRGLVLFTSGIVVGVVVTIIMVGS